MDHCLRHVEALLVVAPEPAPACYLTEGALDATAVGQHPEAGNIVRLADNLEDEVPQRRRIQQLGAAASTVAKQVCESWPVTCPPLVPRS